jgi:hypothetical protein
MMPKKKPINHAILAQALFNALEGVQQHSEETNCDLELIPLRRYIVTLTEKDEAYYVVQIKGRLNLLSMAVFIAEQLKVWAGEEP